MKVAPKKRGRKAAAVAAPNKEEEETEKKPGAKRGRKATASVEGGETKEKRQNWLCLSQKFLLQQGNFLKT